MANHKLSINLRCRFFYARRMQRVNRTGLIHFFDALSLYLQAGFALSYAWKEVLSSLEGALPTELRAALSFRMSESEGLEAITQVLFRLQNESAVVPHCVWFSVLADLHSSGGGLTRGVESISKFLRNEQQRDLESHCRSLPTKVNIALLLFFLPPTFLWVFAPLVFEISKQFK